MSIFIADSAHALFVRATYLVCHRLISSWKTDLNISLAALEMLSGLARTRIRETGKLIQKKIYRIRLLFHIFVPTSSKETDRFEQVYILNYSIEILKKKKKKKQKKNTKKKRIMQILII
jgi:hypothetical protein